MKLEPLLISYGKINSKWIINLNVRAKTIKLRDENTRENCIFFGYIWLENLIFLTKIGIWVR